MDRAAEIFQALSDPTRLRLLNLLEQKGGICVCELVDALRVPQYNVSRHLQVLRQTGFVEDERRGKWVYYRLRRPLEPFQKTLLRALEGLRAEREDFEEDAARARQRLKLRRDGQCCVGPAARTRAAMKR
jgi:ArsR family transcriptional regulator